MNLLFALLTLTTTNVTWHDTARQRDVPAKIYAPAGATNLPLVVFSHGLGGTREGYAYVAQHWATNGYICVVVQHPGSDDTAWRGHADKAASMRAAANADNARHRPQDVSFAITQMLTDPRVNTNAIGVAGHSFGAHTTLAVAGMRLGGQSYRDPRVRAAIPMSAPRPLAAALADITIPCLHLTGTQDDSPLFGTTAKDRRFPFDHITAPGQWLVTFDGATHMTFAGRGEAKHLEAIRLVTTKFWDAHLKLDTAAAKWLTNGDLERALQSVAVIERKDKP